MDSYLTTLCAVATIAVSAVAATNIIIDSGNAYSRADDRQKLSKTYVDALQAHPDGLVFLGEERHIKLQMASRIKADCIAVGSSHEMQLNPVTAPQIFANCSRFINLAVSGGGYEDFISIAGSIVNSFTGHLAIGIGPWFFRWRADDRFLEARSAYEEGRIALGLKPDARLPNQFEEKIVGAVSADYFKANLQHWYRSTKSKNKTNGIRPAADAQKDESVYEHDGTFVYPSTVTSAQRPAIPRGNLGNYKIRTSIAIEAAVATEFNHVVRTLKARKIKVSFVLSPYHPAVLKCLQKQVCDVFARVEAHVRNIAELESITVFGSYDPRTMNLTPSDFLDGMHMERASLRKLVPTSNPWIVTSNR